MKRVIPLKKDRTWGHEIILYSTIEGKETKLEYGSKVYDGPLIRVLTTSGDQPIVVCPTNEYAKKNEGRESKGDIIWYVIDTLSLNASLYLGTKAVDAGQVARLLDLDKIDEAFNKVEVVKNSIYTIPAGLVHGIGANLMILEIKDVNPVTYLYYDDEIASKKNTHLQHAMAVQKNLPYDEKPKFENGLSIYKNKVGTFMFGSGIYRSTGKAIFVNIVTFDTHLIEKDEVMQSDHFAVVSLEPEEVVAK